MMEITARAENSVLHLVPVAVAPEARRAVCQVCHAHAAVVATGASISGACSVCGSDRLQVLDARLPPPRRSAR